jgi:dihydrofolate reductase
MLSSAPLQRPRISLIAAVARNGGIGRGNDLVWRESEDLQRFKRLTLGHPIIMGRRNWDSIGRPLPGRRSIVLSRNTGWQAAGAERAASLDEALRLAGDVPQVFVIGGAEVYAAALPRADELLLTEIDAEFPADTFFPAWQRDRFAQTAREPHQSADGVRYAFTTYKKLTPGD